MLVLGREPKATDLNVNKVNKGMHVMICRSIGMIYHLSASGG